MGRQKHGKRALPSDLPGSLFQKGGGRWYFKCPAHGVPQTSLHTTDRAEAIVAVRRRFGYLTATAERDKQAAVVESLEREAEKLDALDRSASKLPLANVWERYRQVLTVTGAGRGHADAADKVTAAPSTLASTKSVLNCFLRWLRAEQPQAVNMNDITPATCQRYLLDLRGRRTAGTVNRHLAGLRVVWGRLRLLAGLRSNPWANVDQIPPATLARERIGHRPFTPEELATIDKASADLDDRAAWIRPAALVGFYTGLRLSDVCTLRLDGIDFDGGFLRVHERKTAKDRTLYAPGAVAAIREWLPKRPDGPTEAADYVFPRQASELRGLGRKPDRTRPSKEFVAFLRDLGIDHNDQGRAGFHSLRVTAGTLTTQGAGLDAAQTLLGHSSAAVTAGHYDRPDDRQAAARAIVSAPALSWPGAGSEDGEAAAIIDRVRARLAVGGPASETLNDLRRIIG